jgi:hypothetical protein
MYFDQRKTIGALGTLIAAKWYRSQNPHHLLISLDSAEARRWMNFDDDGKRADLLGLAVDDAGKLSVDILEVKSGEDAREVYITGSHDSVTGKPVEQLLNTHRSIAAIFGLNELKDHILTPPRREILRNHFYRQGFSGNRSSRDKQLWGDHLNALFNGDSIPDIRMNLVVVNFGINREALDKVYVAGTLPMRVIHLNETAVSVHLSGNQPKATSGTGDGKFESRLSTGPQTATNRTVPPIDENPVLTEDPDELALPTVRKVELSETIRLTCRALRAACEDYQIRVSEIDPDLVDIGPSVLRYKIQLAAGEQGEKLRRQAENIARQLSAASIPVVDRLPNTNLMYLDMARPDRETVILDSLLFKHRITQINELPLHIGVDPSGKGFQLDLGDDRLPHILVAGGTGSGKTIFLYSIVLSLIAAHSEGSLELAIIDPKQTDFAKFVVLPHLRNHKVITDASEGVQLLRAIADVDMSERSRILQEPRHRDIKAYNTANPSNVIRPLVVIIDEYADLVAVLPKKEREQFDLVVSRLAARGRNVGIHLIIATQRPTADVITGNIKANMSCRISFSLPSGRDSQVILDEPGAERLLRKGDMLLMFEGQLTRLQGYFTNPDDLDELLRRIIREPK